MNQVPAQWAKDQREIFEAMGISLEIVDHTEEIEKKKLQNPARVVFFDSKKCMGQICVWMSGIADMEILDSEGDTIYYKYYDEMIVAKYNLKLFSFCYNHY
jgi:hypothetical protein